MIYDLSLINSRVVSDPVDFVEDCDAAFRRRIDRLAKRIIYRMWRTDCRIMLVCGPSASGKTTTAMKLDRALEKQGIVAHVLSMDNYYKTLDIDSCPRTPSGEPDLESPLCLDIDLMNQQIAALSAGEEVMVPYYDFSRQRRDPDRATPLRLGHQEMAIFEGIHALNDDISGRWVDAAKLYMSPHADFYDGEEIFNRGWVRLIRRTVRDAKFRSCTAEETLKMWQNIRRGERIYIDPYKNQANLHLNTTHSYELCAMRDYALPLFEEVKNPSEQLKALCEFLRRFVPLEDEYVPPASLLREFIGGGVYQY